MENKVINKKQLFIIILSILLVIVGSTVAWFTWRSEDDTKLVLTVGDIAEIVYDKGNSISASNIGPVLDINDGEYTTFTFRKRIEASYDVGVYITPSTLPSGLKEDSFKIALMKSSDGNSYSLVKEVSFKNKNVGTKYLVSGDTITDAVTYYKVVIYIDGKMINPNSMMGQTFSGVISVEGDKDGCFVDDVEPNAPVLADGMIPIKWDGTKWVKASTDNWYNYSNKEWANAVMVRTDKDSNVNGSSSREQYMSAIEGTKILESDILAYYVWIPRYRYKLFNVSSEVMSSIEICTQFESGTPAKQAGSVNGSWLTHPGFTYGEDELSGIWVGKFETSVDDNDACYTSPSSTNCNKALSSPRIKPNRSSLIYQNVSNQFLTAQKIGTVTYLTPDGVSKTDAHMIKNTEWGAVAYLKQSRYGLGVEAIANNSYKTSAEPNYMAGCGPKSLTDYNNSTTTCNAYNTDIGVKASTTGNITGVYDMAGGSDEYVMGILKTSNGTGLSYASTGFTTSTLPLGSKYVDAYTYGTDVNDFSRRILGDATGEVKGWYGGRFGFPFNTYTVFRRGGMAGAYYSGIFYFYRDNGYSSNYYSFHSALAVNK